mgnify:CR=1 FL=1
MGVGDGGHGVDLEVLVRSNVRNCLNWAPVGERWLGVVEPLVAHVLDVVVVDVGNSLRHFSAGQSSAELHHLLANLVVDALWGFSSQQLVVQVVSSSDHLDVVEVVRVDG